MVFTALTRVCPIDRAPLPDPPAPAVCPTCGYVGAPHHTIWSPLVKWWLLSELAAPAFNEWQSEQDVWERYVRAALLGTHLIRPNPWGLAISTSTPVADLYPLAVERAQWWKGAGSPIAKRVLAAPSTESHSSHSSHSRAS
jgi:hypothetical protein